MRGAGAPLVAASPGHTLSGQVNKHPPTAASNRVPHPPSLRLKQRSDTHTSRHTNHRDHVRARHRIQPHEATGRLANGFPRGIFGENTPVHSISSPRVKNRAVTLLSCVHVGARRALTAAVLSPLWFFRLSQDEHRCAHFVCFMHRGHTNPWSVTEEYGW